MIYHFDTIGSTNDEASSPRYRHGDIIQADYQTCGRGQRGNRWSAEAGQNLMFTLILEPTALAATEQFSLLEAVALALVDVLSELGIVPTIKWTNDIYVGDHKLAGVLIENTLRGAFVSRSIVGIGLNVNQREFYPSLPNPTSLARLLGHELECGPLLERLHTALMARTERITHSAAEHHSEYLAHLYRRGIEADFITATGTPLHGTIIDVHPHGTLHIQTPNGTIHHFQFKEIQFVI